MWLLEEFGPEFTYIKGEHNHVADALSHLDAYFNNPLDDGDEEHVAKVFASEDDLVLKEKYPIGAPTTKGTQLIVYKDCIVIPEPLQPHTIYWYHTMCGPPVQESMQDHQSTSDLAKPKQTSRRTCCEEMSHLSAVQERSY